MRRVAITILVAAAAVWCLAAKAEAVDSTGGIDTKRGLRIQLQARRSTILSSELAARINKLDLLKGDRFRKGDVLVSFDCRVERAKLKKARARLDAAKKTAEVSRRLDELDSVSVLEVEKSLTEVMEAEADIAVMEAVVSKCALYAPFSGRVAVLHARNHQFVSVGQQLLEILDPKDLEVELLVPSRWLTWLKPGRDFSVKIDETGKEYPSKVIRIGARIDPISQTVEVMGRIMYANGELLPGMSGQAFFD